MKGVPVVKNCNPTLSTFHSIDKTTRITMQGSISLCHRLVVPCMVMAYGNIHDIDLGQQSTFIDSGTSLLPDGTKPSPEPYH